MNPNFQLVGYQQNAVSDLSSGLNFDSPMTKIASVLKAPTGAGKTIVMIGILEELFQVNNQRKVNGEKPFVTLWVSDSPTLNEQSINKIGIASSKVSGTYDCELIEPSSFRDFEPGKVYFVNYSKMTKTANLNKASEIRFNKTIFELMEALGESEAPVFLLIDEAHKGTKQKGAKEASTVGSDRQRQTIIKQIIESLSPDKVMGVSATPGQFKGFMYDLGYTNLRDHDVPKRAVIDAGMIKSHIVNITLPAGAESNDVLVKEAAIEYGRQCERWSKSPLNEPPIMLVQVGNDFDKHASQIIQWLMEAYDFSSIGMANAFGEHKNLSYDVVLNGETKTVSLPYVEANSINGRNELQIVFFKEALGEGWDCPRAEILVSLRTSGSETRIEQTVGRILRNPFVAFMDYYRSNQNELGKVFVFTAKYDQSVLQRIANEFAGEVSSHELGDKETITLTLKADVASLIANAKFMNAIRLPSPNTYSEHIQALADYVNSSKNYPHDEFVEFIESLHEKFAETLFEKIAHNFSRERFDTLIRPKLSRDEVGLHDGKIEGKGSINTSGFRSEYDINLEYEKWSIWGVPELKDELLPVMQAHYGRVKEELVNHESIEHYKKDVICKLVMLSMKQTMKSMGEATMEELGKEFYFTPKPKLTSAIFEMDGQINIPKLPDIIERFDLDRAGTHRHYHLVNEKLVYLSDDGKSCQKVSFDSALESKVLKLLLERNDVEFIWRNDRFGIKYTKHEVDEHVFMPDYLGIQNGILYAYEPKTITQDHFFDKLKGTYKWLEEHNQSGRVVDAIWFVQVGGGKVIEVNLTQHGRELVRSGKQALEATISNIGTRVF